MFSIERQMKGPNIWQLWMEENEARGCSLYDRYTVPFCGALCDPTAWVS